jgi:hypothetical protein
MKREKGKFRVSDDENVTGCVVPPPTAAESRRYSALLDAAVQLQIAVDAMEGIRSTDIARLYKHFPLERRARIVTLLSCMDSTLYELENELSEIVEADNDDYAHVALLNELDADAKKAKTRKVRQKKHCSGAR